VVQAHVVKQVGIHGDGAGQKGDQVLQLVKEDREKQKWV